MRAAPDGYTISFGHLGTHVANAAIYPLPYDMLTDLDPVVMLPSNPMVVVSKNALPAKNLQELVAWLKANQDKATAGTAGAGSGSHIGGVYLQTLINARFAFVPYRGTAPALNDLVAGQIDIIVDQASNSHAADPIRQHPRLCGHGQQAARGRAEHPHRRRRRSLRLPHDVVERALGAEGHAQGHRRAAQRGRGGGARRSGGEAAAGRPGPRDSIP